MSNRDRLVARGRIGPVDHATIRQSRGKRARIRRAVHTEQPERALARRRRDRFGDDAGKRRALRTVGANGEVVDGVGYAAVTSLEGGVQAQFDHGIGQPVCTQAIEQIQARVPARGKTVVKLSPEFLQRFGAIFQSTRLHRSLSSAAYLLLQLYVSERFFLPRRSLSKVQYSGAWF